MHWLLFIPACFALNMAPGPNNVTAFSNGARFGFWSGLASGMGRLPAFAFLIMIAAIGLGAALATSALIFVAIKLAGAVYLVFIGIRMWRAKVSTADLAAPASVRSMAKRDFLIAISNPKAIAVFTAFFPQFLDLSQPVAPQFLQLGLAFLAMEVVAVAIYVAAGRLAGGIVNRTGVMGVLNKGVGGFLIFSGLTLAISK